MKHPVQMRFIASLFLLSLTLSLKAQDTIPTIKIGKQVWMVKNLDVVTFRNGDTIPEAKTYEAWVKASEKFKPAWCNQANLPEYGQKYGKLYNWYAVNDARGLAPKGYHVPSEPEWHRLVYYLGDDTTTDKKLKSTEGWREEGNGTNESGFAGFPGGFRTSDGSFSNVGTDANWWTTTGAANMDEVFYYGLRYFRGAGQRSSTHKGYGLSVRCLRD